MREARRQDRLDQIRADMKEGGKRAAETNWNLVIARGGNSSVADQRRVQRDFMGKDRRTGVYTYPAPDFLYRQFATEAQAEAKVFSDRGLLEAIYILLRRNDLAQQNYANTSLVIIPPGEGPA
jgi:hypothetical protein